jgi:hypothetical protein
VGESCRAREQLVRLKWCVTAVTVGLVTLLKAFYLTVVNVPAVDCLIEWVVEVGLVLVLIHFTFTVVFRVNDSDQRAHPRWRP